MFPFFITCFMYSELPILNCTRRCDINITVFIEDGRGGWVIGQVVVVVAPVKESNQEQDKE